MKKADVTVKMLKAIAEDLNDVMGFDSNPIPTTGKRAEIIKEVLDAAIDIEQADIDGEKPLKADTIKHLKVLGWEGPKDAEEETEEEPAEETAEEETAEEETAEEPTKKETAKGKGKGKGKGKAKGKTKPKGQAPKKASEKGPGIIASILEFVTEHGPITKEDIVKRLEKRFPDRDTVAMGKTVQCQLPKRMSKEKKVNIVKTDEGFEIQ